MAGTESSALPQLSLVVVRSDHVQSQVRDRDQSGERERRPAQQHGRGRGVGAAVGGRAAVGEQGAEQELRACAGGGGGGGKTQEAWVKGKTLAWITKEVERLAPKVTSS